MPQSKLYIDHRSPVTNLWCETRYMLHKPDFGVNWCPTCGQTVHQNATTLSIVLDRALNHQEKVKV